MQTITFRPATAEDAAHIGANLRAADFKEISLSNPNEQPAALVEASRGWSVWSRTAEIDGVPAVIFGVTPSHLEGWGVPWLLATDAAMPVARRLVRQCHTQVADMHLEYEYLHNQVHRENVVSIQWLRWLGFTIGTVPCGPGDDFLMFWKRG